jgi:glyoxylase-like metal-dependent hydrolase (beta-lactamase superfamily II)
MQGAREAQFMISNIKVVTSSPEGLWVNSTLIEGKRDAILIDAQLTLSDARRLVGAISESKKNLTLVYITHFHPDHYFGLTVIKEAFPNAKLVALPSTVEDIKRTWESKVIQWKPMYGENIPLKPVLPEPLRTATLTLEGDLVEIVGEVQGDARNNSFVWIPSSGAVVCGDIAYNGVYPWTLETDALDRREWSIALDRISVFKPEIVVAGHKNPDMKDDLSCLRFTQNYLSAYDDFLASSAGNAEEFKAKIRKMFPGLGLEIILDLASGAAFPGAKKAA